MTHHMTHHMKNHMTKGYSFLLCFRYGDILHDFPLNGQTLKYIIREHITQHMTHHMTITIDITWSWWTWESQGAENLESMMQETRVRKAGPEVKKWKLKLGGG